MQPEQGNNVQPDYDFILNSKKPKRLAINLGGGSASKRIMLVAVAFFVLLILIIVVKGLFSSSSINQAAYLSVLQDQQEILHILSTDAGNQNTLINSANQSFMETTTLTMNSYQASIINYLSKNGVKVDTSSLNGNASTAIDSQFKSAISANDFNSVFQTVLSQQLVGFNTDLTKAYSATTGPAGKALLQSQYRGTQLLIRELNQQYS